MGTYLNPGNSRFERIVKGKYVDKTGMISEADNTDIISYIKRKVTQELAATYPELRTDEAFSTTLINTVQLTGNKFIMIIDEWDAPIRETPKVQKAYLEFLRMLFKSSGTTAKIFAAAYMTGTLPIKKDGSQSAISDFREYSILDPGPFAEYTGFTEKEVCLEYSGIMLEEKPASVMPVGFLRAWRVKY